MKPLDFAATLDALAAWEGRPVEVRAHATLPGEPQTHTLLVMRGELGAVQMVENPISDTAQSVAAYPVGPPAPGPGPNGFYVDVSDFEYATALGGLNIVFKSHLHIEVAPV